MDFYRCPYVDVVHSGMEMNMMSVIGVKRLERLVMLVNVTNARAGRKFVCRKRSRVW